MAASTPSTASWGLALRPSPMADEPSQHGQVEGVAHVAGRADDRLAVLADRPRSRNDTAKPRTAPPMNPMYQGTKTFSVIGVV